MSTETPEAPDAAGPPAPVEPAAPACQNCGAALLGPHCHACGQPVKGLVRHFSSVIGDFFDSVFDFDSRTLRTLWPLFARPGYLTCEYFEGRRVRYVSPVRLFFFLAIVAFFVASLTLDVESSGVVIDTSPGPTAAAAAGDSDGDGETTDAGRTEPDDWSDATFDFGSGTWDEETNPVDLAVLPPVADAWLNRQVARAQRNIARLRDDPELYVSAILGAVPTTLFVLMPVFAVLLKAAYLFKRRLYMEHLIVALHSHAFLCLSLLLMFLLGALGSWVPALDTATGLGAALLFAWMPVYLLLMQKRVYRQGWPMTLLKYAALGVLYMVLLGAGMVFVSLGSLVWM